MLGSCPSPSLLHVPASVYLGRQQVRAQVLLHPVPTIWDAMMNIILWFGLVQSQLLQAFGNKPVDGKSLPLKKEIKIAT